MRRSLAFQYLITAFDMVLDTPEGRMMLVYRDGDGVFLEIHERSSGKRRVLQATDEIMGKIGDKWQTFTEFLSNAGVENVEWATPCRPISKASPARSNSPSSEKQRTVL